MQNSGGTVPPTDETEYHDLLAAGVHEARRPLALIRGYVETLRDGSLGPLSADQGHALQRIAEKVAEVRAQLDRIDVVARLQRPVIHTVDVVLEDEVRQAVERGAAKADLLGGRLDFESAKQTNARADRTLLTQILDNLIDNALTYARDRPSARVEVLDGATPAIRVSDTGPGLSPEAAARAFERGYREHPEDDDRPGSGIGLYLSRNAAERMGGSLELDPPEDGTGASFVLRLARV